MDHVSPEKRSWLMSRVGVKDTPPEIMVRKLLHKNGFRYRLHRGDLPGKPDITLPRHNLVIFVNGCFWHRHPGCRYASMPKSNANYWKRKFESNVKRDLDNACCLRRQGWKVLVVWQCEIKDIASLERRLLGELSV